MSGGLRDRLQPFVAQLLTSPTLERARRRIADLADRDPTVTLFHDPGDPYSELALQALPRLAARFAVAVRLVPVPPPDAEAASRPDALAAYARADAAMIAPALGLVFPDRPQPPSPNRLDLARRLLVAATDGDGEGGSSVAALGMAQAVGRALWAGDDGALETLAGQHGGVAADTVATRLAAHAADLRRQGHYQGGMLLFRGEWFWGVDRIELLGDRLRVAGLARPGDDGGPVLPRRPELARLPAMGAGTGRRVELFFSFRSPYSAIALPQTLALCREMGAEPVLRPVPPMVTRGVPLSPAKRLYIVRDAARCARAAGVPFGRIADPLPHWQRAAAVFFAAARCGREGPVAEALMTAIWARGIAIGSDRGLCAAVAPAGMTPAEVAAALADTAWRERVADNLAALEAAGHWGVPTLGIDGVWVWGQDRLWLAAELLRRARAGDAAAHADRVTPGIA